MHTPTAEGIEKNQRWFCGAMTLICALKLNDLIEKRIEKNEIIFSENWGHFQHIELSSVVFARPSNNFRAIRMFNLISDSGMHVFVNQALKNPVLGTQFSFKIDQIWKQVTQMLQIINDNSDNLHGYKKKKV